MILSDFNTDSLYKFLTTFGIVMVIFSVMHPMEKKNEIELKNNEFKKDLSLIQLESQQLIDSAFILNNLIIKAQSDYEKISKSSSIDTLKIKSQRTSIKNMYSKFHNKKFEIEKKECTLLYNNKEIKILEEQIKRFSLIANILQIVGWLFIIFGFSTWWKAEKDEDGITKIKIM